MATKRRSKRRLTGLVVASFVAALAGTAAQVVGSRSWLADHPPPGEMVDIGTHSLHIHCTGNGEPTVVINSGMGHSSIGWTEIQAGVARHTRVCTYDRAGYAWSQAGPMPRTAQRVTTELLALLDAQGRHDPVILVGHSLGGRHALSFAGHYPRRVAGMVLVDPTLTTRPASIPAPTRAEKLRRHLSLGLQAALAKAGVRLGLIRALVAVSGERDDPIQQRMLEHGALTDHVDAVISERDSVMQAVEHPSPFPPFDPSLPVLVLVHGPKSTADIDPTQRELHDIHRALAERSSRGEFRVVPNTGHNIHWDDPRAVIDAIVETLERARGRDRGVQLVHDDAIHRPVRFVTDGSS